MNAALAWFLAAVLFTSETMKDPQLTDHVRINYKHAVSDKGLCRSLINGLDERTADPVQLAYLGALQAIWAKHVFDPFAKLRSFKKGRSLIEKAVSAAPQDIEIRAIRMSVQQNCPAFLRYSGNMAEDRRFITDHRNRISSPAVLRLIREVLNT